MFNLLPSYFLFQIHVYIYKYIPITFHKLFRGGNINIIDRIIQRKLLYTRVYITQRKLSDLSMLTKPEQAIAIQTLMHLP